MKNTIVPSSGGYKNLLSYRKAEIVFDATVYFTKRFFRQGDRTIDQMVQAARSGKQNIVEASLASRASKETEIKLTNVARASQEELLVDYRDFARISGYAEWNKDHAYALRLRELNQLENATYDTFKAGIENQNPEICVNVIIGLIKVTNYLLDRQLRRLEADYVSEKNKRFNSNGRF